MQTLKMSDLDLENKRVLIREDLNVPIDENGNITSTKRIEAALPTIKLALEKNAKVIIMSHLGRPKEGVFDPDFSLEPVANKLAELLNQPVELIRNLSPINMIGNVVLLENVRFNLGETKNDAVLAKQYAGLCDVFVMDAFATAHRAHASTVGVAEFASQSCAGPLLEKEINMLEQSLTNPNKPLLAIVGGSKISTKLSVLEALANKVNHLIVGGGIANTFIAASGIPVGKSLLEHDQLKSALNIMKKVDVSIPEDVVVGNEFSKEAKAEIKQTKDVNSKDMILDIGPKTAEKYAKYCEEAATIVWNGPVGVFEWDQFSEGTRILAQAIADSSAFSIAGGGDTIAAIEKFGLTDKISYISTGGGAFLEWLEGKVLPGIKILEEKCAKIC